MTSSGSNRNNPTIVGAYKALADVIGIFWQFHDERIRLGNIPFAATTEYGKRFPPVPFTPQRLIDESRGRPGITTLNPIRNFNEAVLETMDSSFQQFLVGNKVVTPRPHFLQRTEIPEPTKRFFHPFVTQRIQEAVTLFDDIYPTPPELVYGMTERRAREVVTQRFGNRVRQGMRTGSNVTTQLHLLFGEEFRPRMAIAISKISLEHLADGTNEIGLDEKNRSYTLLDNSTLGLDRKRLRELDAGDTLGCPASMKVSPEAEIFLEQRGVDVSDTTMLDDFSAKLPARVELHMGDWFRGLSPAEREMIRIAPDELSILTGEARRSALEIRESQGCPYGHGRER